MAQFKLLIYLIYFMFPVLSAAQPQQVSRINTHRLAVASPEHKHLMDQYDVTFYKLDLNLERNTTYIEGSVTIEANVKAAPLTAFGFELASDFVIESITVNGVPQPSINRTGSDVTVQLTSAIATLGKVSTVIKYKGTAPSGNSAAIGNGFNTATEGTWKNQVTWSLSEPYAAYEWWPTKQVLTDKADSVHVFVTTSPENKVGSNGLLKQVVTLPNGKRRHEWKSGYPIAYYLISVAVSDYEEYTTFAQPAGAPKPIPIVNYVYKGGAANYFKPQLDAVAPMVEYFSEIFTLYPFAKEKYGHSMAPIGGGMEHQTMTTQSTFDFTLTAHELAHQWFGDNVTCASWEDIWLNEGFASYAEYLALHKLQSPQQATQWMQNAHNNVLSRLNGTLRVPDTTNVGRIFDYRLTYKKGAAVAHMLRFTVNNDVLYFKALQNYQQKYSGKTATTSDLKQAFEETTGLELDYFFEQWYNGEGYPDFEVEWEQKDGQLHITSKQKGSGATPFFKTDMEYRLTTASGDTTIRVTQNLPEEKYSIKTKRQVQAMTLDPDNWVLNTNSSLIQLGVPLGLPNELPSDKITLYPNPAFDKLYFADVPFSPLEARIYDTTGRTVKQLILLRQGQAILQIADLPAGLYHVVLSDEQNSIRKTFVKVTEPIK
ncbi:M1 family aminopeptidase [Pontibacter arcticus]|nr:M1 family aminopeptidase [Pontibacter arcticus]